MSWIGSALRETNLSVAWHTSSVRTFDDLFDRELIVASRPKSGPASCQEDR